MKNNEKSLILFVLHPEYSGYHATFKLVGELMKRGHRVIYVGDRRFQVYVTTQGFEYKVIEPDRMFIQDIETNVPKDFEKYGKLKKIRCRIRMQSIKKKKVFQHLVEKTEIWLKKQLPDVVLIQQGIMGKAIPFLKNNIPIIGLHTNLASSFHIKIPPSFSCIIPKPGVNFIGCILNLLGWLKIYARLSLEGIGEFLLNCFGFGIFSYHKAFSVNKLIKGCGGKIQWWEYNKLRLKVPEIVTVPQEFDYSFIPQTDHRCYAGTTVYMKQKDMSFNWGLIDQKKPLILCSIGSHWTHCKNRMRFYRAVIGALCQRLDLQLILHIYNKADALSFYPLPPNIVILSEWIPQLKILSRTYIFITHGGMSSIREAIYAGVPMIVFPWGVDQPGTGARIVFHHLGLMGDIRKVTPEIVGGFIDKISNDRSYFDAVKKMREIFLDQENCKKGVEFIEKIIKTGKKLNANLKKNGNLPSEEKRVTIEI